MTRMVRNSGSRERIVVLLLLLAISACAWAWLVTRSNSGGGMISGAMAPGNMAPGAIAPGIASRIPMDHMATAPGWRLASVAPIFVMWCIMMLGMMLPSAAPMVMTFATISRRQRQRGEAFVPTAVFVCGYLLVWALFSAAASLLQLALDHAMLLSPAEAARNARADGALFILAGFYQFTALKHVCLRHCRSPFAFLLEQWRDGWTGALHMGWLHGLYCLGCCWVLMLLLFAVGVMNLLWVALIASLILTEKLLPRGNHIGRLAGIVLMAIGGWMLVAGMI